MNDGKTKFGGMRRVWRRIRAKFSQSVSEARRDTNANSYGAVINHAYHLKNTSLATTIARTELKTLLNESKAAGHINAISRSETLTPSTPLLASKASAEIPYFPGERMYTENVMPGVKPLSEHQKAAKPTIDDVLSHEVRPPYVYLPLNEAAQEIRLLTILSSDLSSKMRATLHIKAFKKYSGLEFEALSHTWGSPETPVDMLINDLGSIKVTQALAVALPYLRHSDRPRIIWIDAVCIDQQDWQKEAAKSRG